ncbi:Polynucleotide 5'-hydroxyl-kinase grc3 [Gryganskiella cystojenkinii]|nr:Polynucleotide 5'-hydroxyl-kinase grc3 [Gryganskiella cystojenkinii]
MPPKAKKQKTASSSSTAEVSAVTSITTTTTTITATSIPPSPAAPLSAIAARRQKLLEISNPSTRSTPEVEEQHVPADNLDVEDDEKASLESGESDSDSDSSDGDAEDQDQDEATKGHSGNSGTTTPSAPHYERRERKVYLDPQSVSSFRPTRYNIAYLPTAATPGFPNVVLVGLHRGETLVFQGCANIIPIIGHSTAIGYIMSGTADKTRSKKGQNKQRPFDKEPLDLTSISSFSIMSPRTHALAVIESIGLAGSQREKLVPQRTFPTPRELKYQLAQLLTMLTVQDFDTVLAIQSAAGCGILGIEKVVPLFKGILTIKQQRVRGNEDEEKQAMVRFETSLAGFHPILEPKDSIAAMQIPSTWQTAMKALLDATVDENGNRVKKPPVAVVCGGKKMGKSTFSRLIINSMLNRYRKVAFIECDVGQSEFTPVGMVALHVVETPALGAPFTHPRQPYRAFFVGNSTPRDDPDYYMACIQELVRTYYREVSHTRAWADDEEEDEYHSDDDEDEHIPLIINTQGWIKGMGYDLLLQLIHFTVPSFIFGFHSPSNGESNLPQTFFGTMKEQAALAKRNPPQFKYIAAVVLEDENNLSPFTKYHPADHRALALLSYFYLKQETIAESSITRGGYLNDNPVWDFTQALVVRRPWCWDWANAKGIWILFDQVPPSQILHVLNSSLVALTGDKDPSPKSESATAEPTSNAPNYFPLGLFPPPPPEHTTCHGLAIIRSIQPATRTLHLLTPIPISKLEQCNGIVKGAIHMPIHASLDHNEDNSTTNTVPGVAGVPWKNVPYLNYEAANMSSSSFAGFGGAQSPGDMSPRLGTGGFAGPVKIMGADAKVTRKNLGRKRLQ